MVFNSSGFSRFAQSGCDRRNLCADGSEASSSQLNWKATQRGGSLSIGKIVLLAALALSAVAAGSWFVSEVVFQAERGARVDTVGVLRSPDACSGNDVTITVQSLVGETKLANGNHIALYNLSESLNEETRDIDFTGDGYADDLVPLVENVWGDDLLDDRRRGDVLGKSGLGGLLVIYLDVSSSGASLPLDSQYLPYWADRASDTVVLFGSNHPLFKSTDGKHRFVSTYLPEHASRWQSRIDTSILNSMLGEPSVFLTPIDPPPSDSDAGFEAKFGLANKTFINIDSPRRCWTVKPHG